MNENEILTTLWHQLRDGYEGSGDVDFIAWLAREFWMGVEEYAGGDASRHEERMWTLLGGETQRGAGQ